MDIDLLWISGGWFLSSLSDSFMAASASTKMSQAVITLLFVGLLLVLSWSSHHQLTSTSKPSASMSGSNANSFTELSTGTRKLLLLSSSTHHQPASSMEFHPRTSTANRNNRSFRAAAHEVPSGPNPESNK